MAELTNVFGDASRTVDDPGFVLSGVFTPQIVAGKFTATATADELLFPLQDITDGITELAVFDLPT